METNAHAGNGRRLRCLFVSVPFSGIEVYFRTLQKHLAERPDLDATWIYLGWDLDDRIGRLPVVNRNWTLKASAVCYSRIRQMTRMGRRFDVAVFNSVVPLLLLRNLNWKTPTVLTLDVTPTLLDDVGGWYGRHQGGLGRTVSWLGDRFHARRVFRATAEILAWSPLVRNSLIKDYGVREERVSVLPPGLDLVYWNDRGGRASTTGGDRLDRPRILFVGRDFHRKGGDLLLEVASLPEFAGSDFHFVTQAAGGADLPPNVTIHRDLTPNSDRLLDLYRQADIFVLPTRADFYPTNACCEAMAMGLPLITTGVGGLDFLVQDGDGGFIVPPDDPTVLIDRLKLLISNGALRRKFGARNRRYAELHFDLRQKAAALAQSLRNAARHGLLQPAGSRHRVAEEAAL